MIPSALYRSGALALLAALLPLTSPAQSRERMVDGIAAVVNSNVITYGQVRELLMFRQRSLGEMYEGAEMQEKMRESQSAALNDHIERQLIIDH